MNIFSSILSYGKSSEKSSGINKIIEEYCQITLPFEKELLYWFRHMTDLNCYWFYDKTSVRIEDGFTSKERHVINRADEGKYLYFSVYNTSFWEE